MRAVAAITAVALLALPAGRATAQTATQDINITATVLAACTINNVATGITPPVATDIPISTAGAVVTTPITAIGSPFTNVACNAPSNLRLTSLRGGVAPAVIGVPPTGFTNIINYQAAATWNSTTANVDTATPATAGTAEPGAIVPVATANSGDLTVVITPLPNTLPLVTGTYTDTLRVTLTPQP